MGVLDMSSNVIQSGECSCTLFTFVSPKVRVKLLDMSIVTGFVLEKLSTVLT